VAGGSLVAAIVVRGGAAPAAEEGAMLLHVAPPLIGAVFFLAMVLAAHFGARRARRRALGSAEVAESGTESGGDGGSGLATGSLFALLGLLLAFSFSAAFARLDTRRQLAVDEANAIGTAALRLDVLPDPVRAELRTLLGRYARSRAAVYSQLTDFEALRAELARAQGFQDELWALAAQFCRGGEGAPRAMLILPPLNEAFDIAATRTAAMRTHQPIVVFITLAALALVCSGYLGHQAGRQGSLHPTSSIGLAAMISSVMFVIIDAEYPRVGLIHLDAASQLIADVAATLP